jgi:hypothetical protein
MTITERVLSDLRYGCLLTSKQIKNNHNSKNPTSLIARLRKQGHPIYTSERTLGNNHTYKMYRYGHPPREVVALGYQALGASVYQD